MITHDPCLGPGRALISASGSYLRWMAAKRASERDEACAVRNPALSQGKRTPSTRSGVSGSGGGEYATIAQAPGHGTPPGSRGFLVPRSN